MARINRWLAEKITAGVGTMTCAGIFAAIGIMAMYGAFTANVTLTLIAGSISGYFLQLVLLPVILVGQNRQGAISEARAVETHDAVMAELDILRRLHADLRDKVDALPDAGP